MNQSTFVWLMNELQSAQARTELLGACNGVAFYLRGRCSPYLSHRSIEFDQASGGEWSPLWVTFRDWAEGVAINTPTQPEDWADDNPDTSAEAVLLPTTLLRPLVDALRREVGDWLPPLPAAPLVRCVLVRRRLIGWTEEGRPILAGLEPPAEPLSDWEPRE